VKVSRVVAVLAIIGVLGLLLSLVPGRLAPARRHPGAGPPLVVGTATRARPVARPPRAAGTAAAPSSATLAGDDDDRFAGVPELAELDAVHPGLAAAVREARDEAHAALARAGRRCALLLPDEPVDLEWESIDSFEPDGNGTAVLVSQEIHPAAAGNDAFYRCLAEAAIGQTRLALPPGVDAPFEVRGGGRKILDPTLAPDEIHREVTALRERLANPRLTDGMRAVLADHLALYECYEARGPSARRACLEAAQ